MTKEAVIACDNNMDSSNSALLHNSTTVMSIDHHVITPTSPTGAHRSAIMVVDRKASTYSEYDEHGVRLIRDRALPCRMRRIWCTLALLQFLTGAALLITDIYGKSVKCL